MRDAAVQQESKCQALGRGNSKRDDSLDWNVAMPFHDKQHSDFPLIVQRSSSQDARLHNYYQYSTRKAHSPPLDLSIHPPLLIHPLALSTHDYYWSSSSSVKSSVMFQSQVGIRRCLSGLEVHTIRPMSTGALMTPSPIMIPSDAISTRSLAILSRNCWPVYVACRPLFFTPVW